MLRTLLCCARLIAASRTARMYKSAASTAAGASALLPGGCVDQRVSVTNRATGKGSSCCWFRRLPYDVGFCCVSISKNMTLLPAAVAAVVAMTTSRLVESVEPTAKSIEISFTACRSLFLLGLQAGCRRSLARWGRAGGFSIFREGKQTLGGVRGLREDKIGAGFLPERKNPVAKAVPSLLFSPPRRYSDQGTWVLNYAPENKLVSSNAGAATSLQARTEKQAWSILMAVSSGTS